MKRWIAPLSALMLLGLPGVAPAQAPAEVAPSERSAALDHLLWCSSLYFFLASDAMDAGDEEDAALYEQWGAHLLDRASAGLEAEAPTAPDLADALLDMDNRVLEEFSADQMSYRPETCETLL
ncbi:hypothetical protein EMQ25_12735 [Arsenicitalea aurantiaca]|uniref:Uncharacterized protein n=1 Tax=Arsenicitalea aurantiaca TaxID=1783274 RepID=A0A433X806_9HYPH|nr:hypothetical protein [Arsenicitalea aurantiaca]RUT30178.1 hypothetical protein EMQ25_12735 [Arsenicitalea aurantiaca]